MKRLILILALAGAACHPPPTVVTPAGQVAFKADQIVVRVNELQNAAIAANAQGALSEPTTRLLVTFCVGADKTLAQVPAGWPTTLKTSWAETKAKLPPISNPALQSAIAVVDAIIGGLQ